MKRLALAIAVFLVASPALAQEPQWAPPNKELWDAMARALADVPMAKGAHMTVDQILQNVLREAQMRAIRAKTPAPDPAPETPKP